MNEQNQHERDLQNQQDQNQQDQDQQSQLNRDQQSRQGGPQHDETTLLEQVNTQAIETRGQTMNEQHDPTIPFKVEPATPVPDDAVRPDTELAPPPPPVPAAQHHPAPQQQQAPGLVTVRRGPLPMTIMLGLLSLIVAGYVLTRNIFGADLDLSVAGPTMFGVLGGLLLLVGLIGVVASGRGGKSD